MQSWQRSNLCMQRCERLHANLNWPWWWSYPGNLQFALLKWRRCDDLFKGTLRRNKVLCVVWLLVIPSGNIFNPWKYEGYLKDTISLPDNYWLRWHANFVLCHWISERKRTMSQNCGYNCTGRVFWPKWPKMGLTISWLVPLRMT